MRFVAFGPTLPKNYNIWIGSVDWNLLRIATDCLSQCTLLTKADMDLNMSQGDPLVSWLLGLKIITGGLARLSAVGLPGRGLRIPLYQGWRQSSMFLISAVSSFDNAPMHRRVITVNLRSRRSIRYPPLYSLFFNAVEGTFTKFKFAFWNRLEECWNDLWYVPRWIPIRSHQYLVLEATWQSASRCISFLHYASRGCDSPKFKESALAKVDL